MVGRCGCNEETAGFTVTTTTFTVHFLFSKMAAVFEDEYLTPRADNSNDDQGKYEMLHAGQMIDHIYASLGDAHRTAGADNSNDDQGHYESLRASQMIEMAPTGNNNYDEVAEEDSPCQEAENLIAGIRWSARKVVCVFLVCLLVLSVIAATVVVMILYLPRKDGSLSSSLDVLSSTFPTSTQATTTQATTTQATTTQATTTEATYTNRSFTFLNSTGDLGSTCFAAVIRADGDILVVTDECVKLVNRMNLAFTTYNTSFQYVTSIVDHHNIIYLLHGEYRNGEGDFKVESCPPDLNNCQTLFEFNVTVYTPQMAVSSRYIVVISGNLTIYDLISGQRKIKQPIFYFPCFLPDGHLLASDLSSPSISKYRLEEGEPIKLWTCGGLEGIKTVVADAEGYIYGLEWKKKRVYIISPDGELLQTIYNDRLPDHPEQASIRGSEMAVPDYFGKLYLFKINKI